ncbi:MAG: alpha/beta hydrolase [Clostridiales bacterium]|nr:alpha/beta hydrolase [Clostridiales bacterium]
MDETLIFDDQNYQIRTCEINGHCMTYRAFEGISYCKYPLDPVQKLNLYVPEAFYRGESVNDYDWNTAPVFMPNTVGEYLPGMVDKPGLDGNGNMNSILAALEHGYVVASVGVRGRTSKAGKAPALIVDMKAAIRYLRHNKNQIPGNMEWIVTNGTGAGGALSALAGASGNSRDYQIYLKKIGAAEERDDIFAASCYAPIHNLEHADEAYEWMFGGERRYYMEKLVSDEENEKENRDRHSFPEEAWTVRQIDLSEQLKRQFQFYVNHLRLTDGRGNFLRLDENGEGSFKDYVSSYVEWSAQVEMDRRRFTVNKFGSVDQDDNSVEKQTYITIRNGRIESFDWDEFIRTGTRRKEVPAFDRLDLASPENEEFGSENTSRRHFTELSRSYSEEEGEMAEAFVIKRMNPLKYIGKADTAKHWRIRHGTFDRDISLAISVILATKLMDKGFNVDFFLPWGVTHGGDYDLDDLFAWIDHICRE